jgi:hypothetical protein
MLSPEQKAELEERLRLIENSRLEGLSWTDIIAKGCKQFGVTDRQMRRYRAMVKARWRKEAKERENERLVNLNMAVRQRDDLYRRMLATNELANGLRVLQDRDEMLGLYPEPSVKVKHEDVKQIEMVHTIVDIACVVCPACKMEIPGPSEDGPHTCYRCGHVSHCLVRYEEEGKEEIIDHVPEDRRVEHTPATQIIDVPPCGLKELADEPKEAATI